MRGTAGIVLLLVIGCTCKEMPRSKVLGSLDLSTPGARAAFSFACPHKVPKLAIVLDDAQGRSREFCSTPDWPLALRLTVKDVATNAEILTETIRKEDMRFANWHVPSTSVLLDCALPLRDALTAGTTYHVGVTVEKAAPALGKGKVVLHWVE